MSLIVDSTIMGCWLGKSIGGTLGLPAEGKMERLHFSFYNPVPTIAPPNDDLELQLVWLHVVEAAPGGTLTQTDFANAWLNHIHYMWDEYGRTRWNLRRGVPVEHVGTFENPFVSGMGSPIRSEIWACLFPGDPDSAAYYAAMDASLDHGVEGIAGEVFLAVMQSVIVPGRTAADGIESAALDLDAAISLALRYIPGNCETALAIAQARHNFESGVEEWACWSDLLAKHGHDNFTHAPLNVALIVWALLYGGGDFEKSILLAVNGGYDTDCTAATVGATLGLIIGAEGIPARWIEPIGEQIFVGPGIQEITPPRTLSELTDRTVALLGKLDRQRWDNSLWNAAFDGKGVDLATLPGTISLVPADTQLGEALVSPVLWANGELPAEVKRAGGARWIWDVTSIEPRELLVLARAGARLYVDDMLVLECPAGLPYVPAPHRSPGGSRTRYLPSPGRHEVRLELSSSDAEQDASVILSYPNRHICPWTRGGLPHAANLPAE
ncbi:MAG: ADP-ribosylglycohydrolase family protein [Candidatus Methylacidiphilales bacterium]|nr:ADP-ribosylglycohydrolase family protein [Candidatus Methylacidiphilales bacterium]